MIFLVKTCKKKKKIGGRGKLILADKDKNLPSWAEFEKEYGAFICMM